MLVMTRATECVVRLQMSALQARSERGKGRVAGKGREGKGKGGKWDCGTNKARKREGGKERVGGIFLFKQHKSRETTTEEH